MYCLFPGLHIVIVFVDMYFKRDLKDYTIFCDNFFKAFDMICVKCVNSSVSTCIG